MDEQKVPLHELKKRAIAYYSENKVPQNIEKLLNDMFLEEPSDMYGYMVSLIHFWPRSIWRGHM